MNRQPRVGQMRPDHRREIMRAICHYRKSGQQGHCPLTSKIAISLIVVRQGNAAIAVKVNLSEHSPVRGRSKEKGIEQSGIAQPVAQRGQGVRLSVMVDALQQQNIRIRQHDRGKSCVDVRGLAPGDVAQQQTRPVAVQFGVKGGNADGVGGGGLFGARCGRWQSPEQQNRTSRRADHAV